MIKSGMVRQETKRNLFLVPLGYRVLKKIINVIEKFHETAGINQFSYAYDTKCRDLEEK